MNYDIYTVNGTRIKLKTKKIYLGIGGYVYGLKDSRDRCNQNTRLIDAEFYFGEKIDKAEIFYLLYEIGNLFDKYVTLPLRNKTYDGRGKLSSDLKKLHEETKKSYNDYCDRVDPNKQYC